MIYDAVVLGVSAGGLKALTILFTELKDSFKLPVLLVQHLHAHSDDYLVRHLAAVNKMTIKEADEKERIRENTVYIAPPNYHMLVEDDRTISLTIDERVNFCRPSVDVLFDTAAEVYEEKLIGIILTGANEDGARGMRLVHKAGGTTIIQNPKTAEVDTMPRSVLKYFKPDYILNLKDIARFLNKIG